jgi:hypothetical protein
VNPLNPKVGELVQTVFQSSKTGLPVFGTWDSLRVSGDKITEMKADDVGVVLESLEPQGGNGCKVMFSGGKVGWVNINYLEVISVSEG